MRLLSGNSPPTPSGNQKHGHPDGTGWRMHTLSRKLVFMYKGLFSFENLLFSFATQFFQYIFPLVRRVCHILVLCQSGIVGCLSLCSFSLKNKVRSLLHIGSACSLSDVQWDFSQDLLHSKRGAQERHRSKARLMQAQGANTNI